MKLSVVMPARNAEKTLEASVESILIQSRADFEFVIVDHRSTDRTSDILEALAGRDRRIRLFRHEGTFVEAANLAWRSAEGDLIARMDSDDIAHPDRLAKQLDFLDKFPHLAACGTGVNIVKRGKNGRPEPADGGYQRYENWVNSVISPASIFRERFVDSPLPNPTAMIRRTVLEELDGYADPVWAEDYDFWLRLLEKGHHLGKVGEPLLDWYDAPERSTRQIERYELSRFQEAKAHFLSRLDRVRELGVSICGAGPIGKEMAQLLEAKGVHVAAFYEVNKRQIGNQIAGIPVCDHAAAAEQKGHTVLLSAVGQPGARERIRKLLRAAEYREGEDFFCVA
ncbi:MAG: glycosyltransferase [Verrucomicrobiales bacterium]|nr:glycosyltransferase [Verrucomicrobiales bacterium]